MKIRIISVERVTFGAPPPCYLLTAERQFRFFRWEETYKAYKSDVPGLWDWRHAA